MVWKRELSNGDESGKIRWELVEYTRGRGLDIGCGPSKAFPHFIGVDNRKDTKLFGVPMDPDLTVPDASNLDMFASNSMDFVFSSHLLEHIEDHEAALSEWWRVVKVGGNLCLYLPHKNLYPNVGKEGANPDHKHDFSEKDIIEAMKKNLSAGGWDLVRNERRDQDDEYSFFQVYRKREDKEFKHLWSKPKPEKTAAIIRYGAYGDLIQMSSVLPGLKEQGYHITLYTVPRGYEVIKSEPLIDEIILQDNDQVPNHVLDKFWAHLAKKYDRFVNLSESVEGTFLAIQQRVTFSWPHETRHKALNTNYIEFAHSIAQIPYEKPRMRFVETAEEKKQAEELAEKIAGSPLILWCLSGSSVHKIWPHIDAVIARILLILPNAKIVTTGDKSCELIEAPWTKEDRIVKMSGKWSIRETMAFAKQCNLVIGPETGVMSSVAMEPMPKIVMLSHSSHENLTRDWENTYALYSMNTKCYPCHKMHYGWDTCNKGEKTGTALCQEDISADVAWHAVVSALGIAHQLEKAA